MSEEINKLNDGNRDETKVKKKHKEGSSKEESKFYINKIISCLNQYSGDLTDLFDSLGEVKCIVEEKEEEIRASYNLPKFVPQWSQFNSIVVDGCIRMKKNKQRLTFSVFNHWIMEFRELATSNRGFDLVNNPNGRKQIDPFRPIILVRPPSITESLTL